MAESFANAAFPNITSKIENQRNSTDCINCGDPLVPDRFETMVGCLRCKRLISPKFFTLEAVQVIMTREKMKVDPVNEALVKERTKLSTNGSHVQISKTQ